MKQFIAIVLTLAFAGQAAAQKAVIIELPSGQKVGVAYLPGGGQVVLTEITVIKLSDPTPPPPPQKKITQVTFVYEKDQSHVPRPVSLALQRINGESSGSVVASEFEEDTVDGSGETPDQYKIALEAARKAGLPALVVQAGSTVVRVVKDPKTTEAVLEASK